MWGIVCLEGRLPGLREGKTEYVKFTSEFRFLHCLDREFPGQILAEAPHVCALCSGTSRHTHACTCTKTHTLTSECSTHLLLSVSSLTHSKKDDEFYYCGARCFPRLLSNNYACRYSQKLIHHHCRNVSIDKYAASVLHPLLLCKYSRSMSTLHFEISSVCASSSHCRNEPLSWCCWCLGNSKGCGGQGLARSFNAPSSRGTCSRCYVRLAS